MTIVNLSFRSDLEFATSANRQTDAENQKQAWLRQMELNEMTLLPESGSQHNVSPKKSQNGTAQSESNQSGTGGNDEQETSKSSADTPSTSLLPVHPILQQADAAVRPEFSLTNSSITALQNAGLSPDTAASSAGALLQSGTALSEQFGNVVTEPVSIISEPGDVAMLNFLANANNLPEATSHATETDQPQKASNSDEQNDVENTEWQKRLIHVAQEGSDVSVSIRDSTLDLHQSTQIVARLAGDAAQSGLRLKNATVNGRTYVKLARNTNNSNASLKKSDLTARLSTSFIETQE